jgi:glycosyltransferase involved in cell wall biosynthesis
MDQSSDSKITYTIIIPCFNEEDAIAQTVERFHTATGHADEYLVTIVNDGSTDRTAEVLSQLYDCNPRLRIINHERNRGYGAALKTGIRESSTELVAITDADGTYPCERIPEFFSLAQRQHQDMVIGSRTSDDVVYPLVRKIPKSILKKYASWLIGAEIPDLNSGLRVFRKSLAEQYIKLLPDGFSFTTTITMAAMHDQHRVVFVPISYEARIGQSKIRPVRDTLNFIQLILRTGMYFGPLRVLSPVIGMLGLAFLLSAAYDIFVLRNLTDKTVMLVLFTLNTVMFALLADMIDRRSS